MIFCNFSWGSFNTRRIQLGIAIRLCKILWNAAVKPNVNMTYRLNKTPPNIKSPESLRSRSHFPCVRTDMKKPTVAFCNCFVKALKRYTKQLPVSTVVWNLTTNQQGANNVTWNFKCWRLYVCYFKYISQCVILLLVSMQNSTHLQWLIICHKPKYRVFMGTVFKFM